MAAEPPRSLLILLLLTVFSHKHSPLDSSPDSSVQKSRELSFFDLFLNPSIHPSTTRTSLRHDVATRAIRPPDPLVSSDDSGSHHRGRTVVHHDLPKNLPDGRRDVHVLGAARGPHRVGAQSGVSEEVVEADV